MAFSRMARLSTGLVDGLVREASSSVSRLTALSWTWDLGHGIYDVSKCFEAGYSSSILRMSIA